MDCQTHAIGIVKKLVRKGYIAYFAGGWVRDYLLGHPSSDIDIATNAPTQVILDLFPRTLVIGLAFGVVIVIIGGHQFEVATFRRDIGYADGRKPQQIELSTPEEDALRRDFTINGMFYDPLEEVIHDFVGGEKDLNKKIIRTIGDPNERFIEDRLRMVRAIRFACRFDFKIDQATQDAIAENADTLFPAVAQERIWQEFNKMAAGSRFDFALIEMHRLKLLSVIFPSLATMHLNEVKKRVAAFANFPKNKNCPTILYLMVLFSHLPLEEKLSICEQLRTSRHEIAIVKLAEKCKQLLQKEHETSPVDWVHFYASHLAQVVLETEAASLPKEEQKALLMRHQLRQESYKIPIERLARKKPLVTASFLMQQGVPPGKLLGSLLKEAEAISICQRINDPTAVLNELQKSSLWRLFQEGAI